MRRYLWHILILGHFCFDSLLVAAKFSLFKGQVATCHVEITKDLIELMYLSGCQIESWTRNYLSQNHDLFNNQFLRGAHRLFEPTKLHFQDLFIQLWMRLVIAGQVLYSKANFAEILLDAIYPVLVLVKVDEKILFIVRQ